MSVIADKLTRKLAHLFEGSNTDPNTEWKNPNSPDYDRQKAEDALYHTVGPLMDNPEWDVKPWSSPGAPVAGFNPGGPAPRWTQEEVIMAMAGDPALLFKNRHHPRSPGYGNKGGSPLFRWAKKIAEQKGRGNKNSFIEDMYGNGLIQLTTMMQPGHDQHRSAFIPWVSRSIKQVMLNGLSGSDKANIDAVKGAAPTEGGPVGMAALMNIKNSNEVRTAANIVKGKYRQQRSHDKLPGNPFGPLSPTYYQLAMDYADALDSGSNGRIEDAREKLAEFIKQTKESRVLIRGASTGLDQDISTPDRMSSIGIQSMDAPISGTEDTMGSMAGTIVGDDDEDSLVDPATIEYILDIAINYDLGKLLNKSPKYRKMAEDMFYADADANYRRSVKEFETSREDESRTRQQIEELTAEIAEISSSNMPNAEKERSLKDKNKELKALETKGKTFGKTQERLTKVTTNVENLENEIKQLQANAEVDPQTLEKKQKDLKKAQQEKELLRKKLLPPTQAARGKEGKIEIGGPLTVNELRMIIRQLGPLGSNYPGRGRMRSNTHIPRDAAKWWLPGEDPEIEPIPEPKNPKHAIWHSIWSRNGYPSLAGKPTAIAKEFTEEVREFNKFGIKSARAETVAAGKEVMGKVNVALTSKRAQIKLHLISMIHKGDLGVSESLQKSFPILEGISEIDRHIIVETCDWMIKKLDGALLKQPDWHEAAKARTQLSTTDRYVNEGMQPVDALDDFMLRRPLLEARQLQPAIIIMKRGTVIQADHARRVKALSGELWVVGIGPGTYTSYTQNGIANRLTYQLRDFTASAQWVPNPWHVKEGICTPDGWCEPDEDGRYDASKLGKITKRFAKILTIRPENIEKIQLLPPGSDPRAIQQHEEVGPQEEPIDFGDHPVN